MKAYIYSVCGYDGLYEEPYKDSFNTSNNIYECCGFKYELLQIIVQLGSIL